MLLLVPEFQEIGFDFTHVDAAGTLYDPAILAATIVSSCILMVALNSVGLIWQSLKGSSDLRRILLILAGCGSYVAVAWIQFELGEVFYRLHAGLGSSTSLGLYVPVVPVWVLGTISAVVLYLFRDWAKRVRTRERS